MLRLAEAGPQEFVGGKAANLGRLFGLSVPVPDGFVIGRDCFDRFVADNALDRALAAHPLDVGDPDTFTRAAAAMQARVEEAVIPARTWSALLDAWTPEGVWIVRSSAVGEDSELDSFAGQLDSILDVRTEAQLERALRSCWGSYWSARALFYQRARGRRLNGMGVVVQRMIDAAMGGVLFTRSPTDDEAIAIEYVDGHPGELVAGAVDPQRVTIDRRRPEVDAPFDELVAIALRLERELGGPQDIEWVIDRGGKLWIVQSRAITGSAPATKLFSNVNVNENYPRPISPLLYSIATEAYEHYFRNLGRLLGVRESVLESIDLELRHCVGVHGARLYYDLSNIHACIRAVPFGDQFGAAFDGFVGLDDERGGEPKSARPLGFRSLAELRDAARVVRVGGRSFQLLPARVAAFERRVDAYVATTEDVGSLSVEHLIERFHGFLDIRFRGWADASLADVAATLAYAWLRSTLARTLGDPASRQLPPTLLLAIPNVVSSGPIESLWALSRLARADTPLRAKFASLGANDPSGLLESIHREHPSFATAMAQHIRDWGYRVSGELMLTTDSYVERPASLLPVLAPYLELDGPSPSESTAEQARRRDRAIAEVLAALPLRWRAIFRQSLRATQSAIGFRERARLRQALLYSRFRAVIRELGARLHDRGQLARADDLLFLTWREVDEWLGGHAMFPAVIADVVALRRQEHARLAEQRPPDTLRIRVGEYPRSSSTEPVETGTEPLIGVGVAGGRVTGSACVLVDLSEAAQFRRGDCLVTRQTDPGWAPLFFLAKGLVMERGGMLSHGAIVAREFGIPGVIAVSDATRRIRSGSHIEVDGDRGRVTIVEEQPR